MMSVLFLAAVLLPDAEYWSATAVKIGHRGGAKDADLVVEQQESLAQAVAENAQEEEQTVESVKGTNTNDAKPSEVALARSTL